MQPRVLSRRLLLRFSSCFALLLLDFRMFPNDARVPRIRGCRGLRTWRRDVRRDSAWFETLLAFGDFGAFSRPFAIRAVLAFGF